MTFLDTSSVLRVSVEVGTMHSVDRGTPQKSQQVREKYIHGTEHPNSDTFIDTTSSSPPSPFLRLQKV
eukprot:scaffold21207_cov198-Skeletonema_marinoi.AAC.6